MTIDANGAVHAVNGRYTNKDFTDAADGTIQPDTRSVAGAQAILAAANEEKRQAERRIAEARVGIITAHVTALYPDTATIVLANSPSGLHTSWLPTALLDDRGDRLWEYDRNPKADLPDDDWVMIGEVIRQVQAIGSEHIDAVLPKEKRRSPLAKRAFEMGWVTHAGPRVIHVN
jgi:hypothetical protein